MRGTGSANPARAVESNGFEWATGMCSSTRCIVVLFGTLFGALLGLACSGIARADDDVPGPTRIGTNLLPGAGNNDAPRLTRTDVQTEPQRSLPGYRNELVELSYRWWASQGRADLGLGLGTIAYVARPTGILPGLAGDGATLPLGAGTVLTLGMRYRTSERSALFADAAGVRGLPVDRGDVVVGKVGIEFKSARSRWNIAYGGLGLRFAGDTRMTLRVRKGGVSVYMHRSF